MSFFDDKQEILKVELTTYGRFLLSRGKFKPTYYSFFDDDVLYDADYANLEEEQNEIQARILEETIQIKPQTTFSCVENNIKNHSLVVNEITNLKEEESQITSDKNYALSLPLANSSLSSNYAPSWSIQFINANIKEVNTFIDNSDNKYDFLQPFLKIPQINLEDINYDIKKLVNQFSNDPEYDLMLNYLTGSEQISYLMKNNPLLINVSENNVDDLTKNFDIEIFMEEEENIPGKDEKKKILKKLNFTKQTEYIINNILLDKPKEYDTEIDESYAEYYFEITADEEIEEPPTTNEKITRSRTSSAQGAFGDNC